jgi:SAM-dependent methyltransferase
MTDPKPARDPGRETSRCPACDSSKFEEFIEAHDFHYGNEGLFRMDRCVACGLWIQQPMPDGKTLTSFYPSDYYSFQPAPGNRWRARIRRLLGLDRHTHLPDVSPPRRLLDVGCGAGHYIQSLAACGWQVSGVEPSAAAAEAGRAAGLEVICGDIHSANLQLGGFDVVRFNHSFEHVPDPVESLEAAWRLLKPAGYLFIGVPNTAGLWAKIFGPWWWYLGLPVHTFGFNPSNLKLLLERSGFEVVQVRYNAEFAGLLGSMQIWLNRKQRPRTSTGRVLASWALRLPALWLCRTLDLLRLGDCIEVIARPNARPRAP